MTDKQQNPWLVHQFHPGIEVLARCTTPAEVDGRPRGEKQIDAVPYPYLVDVFDRVRGTGNQWSAGAQWNSLPWSWRHLDLYRSGHCTNCGREILNTAMGEGGTVLIAHAD